MKHHPTANRQINFGKSDRAKFSDELFKELRKARKFALRLGEAQPDGEWRAHDRISKKLLKIHEHATYLESVLDDPTNSDDEKSTAARVALGHWTALQESDVVFPFRQKGVDMRIGLDIAAMTLKRQVDTIILVTGDADFIPAAKLARREGVEFLLDPMWQSVNDDLLEHIDGLQGGFDRPGSDSEPEDNDE